MCGAGMELDMAGRKPIPTEVRKARGVRSHKAKRTDEPIAPPGAPEMPKHLSKAAKELWPRKVEELMAMNVLSPAHGELLAIYCEAVVDEAAAKLRIAKEGSIIDTPFGKKVHPAVRLRREAAHLAAKIAAEFGMTPASQTRAAKTGKTSDKQDGQKNPALRLYDRANRSQTA